jgi:hypothetical protein
MQTEAVDPGALWHEVRPILDEGISRLPEKYRLPIVLRYLQGKSHQETAQELGCPPGTLSWRLSQARELLARWLARRGLMLSAVLLETLLADNAFSSGLPPALATASVQVGMACAAGEACPIAIRAIQLAEGAMKAMSVTKLKAAAVVGLALVLLGGGWGVLIHRDGGTEGAALAVARDAETKSDTETTKPEQGGNAVNGMKLILTADKMQTAMKADGSNAEPVKLKLTFANVGEKEIQVPVPLWFASMALDLTRADKQQILTRQLPLDGLPDTSRADYMAALEPNQTISIEHPFPSGYSPFVEYLLKPGEYHLKITYDSKQYARYNRRQDGVYVNQQPIPPGSWTGTLTSNELVLKVVPFTK